ncbi:MAG: carboxylating nicotinate-nucleotide diphosphorylase [Actinobacteria bacterium]|nr:carboxylating nicotinate-nucleotide diphosphorylase [Actinomycetota bacterium]
MLKKEEIVKLKELVRIALREDLGQGFDITTWLTVPANLACEGNFLAKSDLVLCGIQAAKEVFSSIDNGTIFKKYFSDGDFVRAGHVIARVSGLASSILTGERTALNFLNHLSGISTLTRRFVEAVEGTGAKIVDTRKTVPGLRWLEKYAVRCGGGCNHRFGLFDGILIKDNHIIAAGGTAKAVQGAREGAPHLQKIEVEVSSLDELRQALDAGADVIMLDNMSLEETREAVKMCAGRCIIEASGNVMLERVRDIALCGVDLISTSQITMSAKSSDISLELKLDKSRT